MQSDRITGIEAGMCMNDFAQRIKPIIKVVIGTMKKDKKRAIIMFVSITLAIIPVVVITAYTNALDQLQYNINYGYLSRNPRYTPKQLDMYARDDEYYALVSIGLVLDTIIVLSAMASIKSVISYYSGEKSKNLAILSSLGASTFQKIALLSFDALITSIAAVPMGVLTGFLIASPLISSLNDISIKYFTGLWKIEPLYLFKGNITLYIFLFLLFGFGIVSYASYKPALALIKKSQIELARTYDAINISLKPSIFDVVFKRLFGITGRLACCNYINNKKRYRQFSLVISSLIVICILMSLFMTYIFSDNDPDLSPEDIEFETSFIRITSYTFVSIFITFLISTTSNLFLCYRKRKPEFAMLKSIGVTDSEIKKMIMIESIYQGIYTFIYTMIGVFIGDKLLSKFIVEILIHKIAYIFPFWEIIGAFFATMFISLILSVIMISILAKGNIVENIRKAY